MEVERRPVNEAAPAASAGSAAGSDEEQTVEISETSEEAVVTKEAVITEEVNVRRSRGGPHRADRRHGAKDRSRGMGPLNPPGGSAPRRPGTRPTTRGRH